MNEKKAMMKDALVLMAITLIAGLILGVVFQVTKGPIAIQEEKTKQAAWKEVFEQAATFSSQKDFKVEQAKEVLTNGGFVDQDIKEVAMALDSNEQVLGHVITVTSHEGYGGDITFSIGIQNDGTINGISLLAISETPGLGMKAEDVLKPQYANKKVTAFEAVKSGAMSENQIDAISGATITTNAVNNGVNAGLFYLQNVIAQTESKVESD